MFTPTEPNDTILLANLVELDSSTPVAGSGAIETTDDVDLFAIELNSGDTILADINAEINGSDLDSVLSIFDSDGNLLVQNENNSFEDDDGMLFTEIDPFQEFTAVISGTYYVGVSSAGNLDYDPNDADSGSGDSSGDYSLELTYNPFAGVVETEPNDTISLAQVVQPSVGVSGEIGNNQNVNSSNDVDLFEVTLNAGDTLSVDINARIDGSPLDSVLTIFDSDGNLLLQNEDNTFEDNDGTLITEPDPLLFFTPLFNGTYYIGVSSAGNLGYDPTSADSGVGTSSGSYNVVLNLETSSGVVETEANDIISSADEIELDSLSPVVISGEIGNNSDLDPTNDVDLFEIELDAGDSLFADINAAIRGSSLDSVLTVFDENGVLLAQNDDNSFDDTVEPDSFLEFIAETNGTYYLGVSSSGNLDYNPNTADSGTGDTSGSYSLELTFNPNSSDEEPNDTIGRATEVELDRSSPVVVDGEIGDNPNRLAGNDVDLFEIELNDGDTLTADINAQSTGSSLNSFLILFDSDGNELARNNNENASELDSFLEFTAEEDATYYIGISSVGNANYDPTVAGSGGTGRTSGDYSLELNVDGDTPIDQPLLNTPINRFQNSNRPGTFLFATEEESIDIRANFPEFDEEGQAFEVANAPGDGLIRINRFQNSNVSGTYLFATEEESIDIRANFPQFLEEGIAFYVYPGSADIAEDFYRFQNTNVSGTYVFVTEGERQDILNNFPEFVEEGVAFEAEI